MTEKVLQLYDSPYHERYKTLPHESCQPSVDERPADEYDQPWEWKKDDISRAFAGKAGWKSNTVQGALMYSNEDHPINHLLQFIVRVQYFPNVRAKGNLYSIQRNPFGFLEMELKGSCKSKGSSILTSLGVHVFYYPSVLALKPPSPHSV